MYTNLFCFNAISLLTEFPLIAVIAIKGSHTPVILKKSTTIPILINLSKKQFTLYDEHSFITHLGWVHPSTIFLVNEFGSVAAFPALQHVLVGFVLVYYVIALGQGLHQKLAIAQFSVAMFQAGLGFFGVGVTGSRL